MPRILKGKLGSGIVNNAGGMRNLDSHDIQANHMAIETPPPPLLLPYNSKYGDGAGMSLFLQGNVTVHMAMPNQRCQIFPLWVPFSKNTVSRGQKAEPVNFTIST